MKISRLLLLTLTVLAALTPLAQAKIDLVPRKVVIDGRSKNGEIIILNLGQKPSTFRIGLVNYKQHENGVYEQLEGPLNTAFDPEKIIRLSPRQFTLPPGGRQKVRFSLRTPPDLPKGEYHFHVSAIEFTEDAPDPEAGKSKQISVKMNLGVSIPVIYRNGDLTSEAKMSNLTLVSADKTESKLPELQMRIDRKGTAGAAGNLEIFWQPAGGESKRIGVISNMNLFTEINYRDVQVPLDVMPNGTGTIRVRYTEDAGMNKDRVFDEIVLQR